MSNSDCKNILYMFIRPGEPSYIPKGKEKVVFDIPCEYLPKRYQQKANDIMNHFDNKENRKISIDPIDCTNLHFALELGRDEQFSEFLPHHKKMAGKLIDIFMGKNTFEEFLSAAAFCRDQINSKLFIYALSVAILHRPDTKHLSLPSLTGVFPHLFVNALALKHAKEDDRYAPDGCRPSIVIGKDHTASDLEVEHRVAYFREDLGVSLHHWHWHTVYPYEGAKEVVDKDRRGELFYYMHQQILARYNFERLSSNLSRVKSLSDWREPIPEGYFPKLGSDSFTTFYPGRHSDAILKDYNRKGIKVKLQDLDRMKDRILEAIHRGTVTKADGQVIKLTESSGIDILGNMIEASSLSPNPTLYGNLHNDGHTVISGCHDPDNRHLENTGVMGENTTAMRDPVFYRWHEFINDIFEEHKNLLPPYGKEQLDYKDIEVNDVRIIGENLPPNSFRTYWQQSEVDISKGLDFLTSGTVRVTFIHLNHVPFRYKIKVTNSSPNTKIGTVRIFMAPKKNESGLPFAPAEQRLFMTEMDKFTVTLRPGENTLERRSDESSVTIPFEQTFPILNENESIVDKASVNTSYCGCGWPQHLLIPKGTEKGFPVDLFVMVSNFDGDKVDQGHETRCKDAASFCGLRDKKYPDARAMGFPFDRPLGITIDSFEKFRTGNMNFKEMSIIFTDKTITPRE